MNLFKASLGNFIMRSFGEVYNGDLLARSTTVIYWRGLQRRSIGEVYNGDLLARSTTAIYWRGLQRFGNEFYNESWSYTNNKRKIHFITWPF